MIEVGVFHSGERAAPWLTIRSPGGSLRDVAKNRIVGRGQVSRSEYLGYRQGCSHTTVPAGNIPYAMIKDAAGYRAKRAATKAMAAFQARRDARRAIIVARLKSMNLTKIV